MKKNFNIIRQLRLQLKTGFLKEEPVEYTFLRRYPPMHRDKAAPSVEDIPFKSIPYLKLYEKAIARNPLYEDEKVYAGYWQQEPQALSLAKKQYEYIQQGLSEEEAYSKACDYVYDLESKSYEALKDLTSIVNAKDGKAPFMSDPTVMDEVQAWKVKLSATKYEDLKLAEKGELDYLIQVKILKWNEVERERRMKDPLYTFHFEKLRNSLFPDIDFQQSELLKRDHQQIKTSFFTEHSVMNPDLLKASEPFYYDSYKAFFDKALKTPDYKQWSKSDQLSLSRWIVDTLAFQYTLERSVTVEVQEYLQELKDLFFPMFARPTLVDKLTLPSESALKELLFKNGIGYKQEDKGLYIRRFYKLPLLLFPQESFQNTVISNATNLRNCVLSDSVLVREMWKSGLINVPNGSEEDEVSDTVNEAVFASSQLNQADLVLFGRVKNELSEVWKRHPLNASRADGVADASADDDSDSSSSSSDSDSSSDSEVDAEMMSILDNSNMYDKKGLLVNQSLKGKREISDEEWEKLVKKYFRNPSNSLDKDREQYYLDRCVGKSLMVDDCVSEADLMGVLRFRQEKDMITRARLAILYEEKESQRRSKEWRRRKIWSNNELENKSVIGLPSPELNV